MADRSSNLAFDIQPISLPVHDDGRGKLCVAEVGAYRDIPFGVQRAFVIYDVPDGKCRGGHYHDTCNQALILIKGKVKFQFWRPSTDDDDFEYEVIAQIPGVGFIVPPNWCMAMTFYNDASLLVLADEPYAPERMHNCDDD